MKHLAAALCVVSFAGCGDRFQKINEDYDPPTATETGGTSDASSGPGTGGGSDTTSTIAGTGSASATSTIGTTDTASSGATSGVSASSGGTGSGSGTVTATASSTSSTSSGTASGSTSGGCGDDDVMDLTLTVSMDHTRVGDLVFKLITPSNTVATLMSRPGISETTDGGSEPGGTDSNLEKASPILFNDAFSADAEDLGKGLSSGQLACKQDGICEFFTNQGITTGVSMAELMGEPSKGSWTFCIGDDLATGLGEIRSWQLDIQTCGGGNPKLDSSTLNESLSPVDGMYDGTQASMFCDTRIVP